MSSFTRCPAAKEYFKENSHHWSWAVQWLQKKVKGFCYILLGSSYNMGLNNNASYQRKLC